VDFSVQASILGVNSLFQFFQVFGSLVSTPLRVSDHFYGTGQSFLFRLKPEFQLFKWTGENMYFIKGNTESLSIGAGEYVFQFFNFSIFQFFNFSICTVPVSKI
jgi:hypothetical protein